MVHMLRYLKNAADLESKAQFLYYIGKTLQTQLPVHDFIARGMMQKSEPEFEKWLEEALKHQGWPGFQALRRKSLYESVARIITHFIPREKEDAYVQYFLDFVLEQDLRNPLGLSDFLELWDKKQDSLSIPTPEGNPAVRIISIHKSKGLEFPVVIFPFADEQYSRQRRDRLWVEADVETFGLERVLIDSNKNVLTYGESPSETYKQRQQEELLDNINVLYVALTRAEEQLYIISQMQQPDAKTGNYPDRTASYFIEYLEQEGIFDPELLEFSFGDPAKQSDAKQEVPQPVVIKGVAQPLDQALVKIAARESQMWGSAQAEAIAYGNTLHEILSGVRYAGDVDAALQRALLSGLIKLEDREQVAQTVNAVVSHPELRDFFDASNIVYNEQPIIVPGALVKPDRMVQTQTGEMLLLDYKTGQHRSGYEAQLEGYAQAIGGMGFTVTRKILVYTAPEVKIIPL